MSRHPGGFPNTGDGSDCVSNSTWEPQRTSFNPYMQQSGNLGSARVAQTPTRRAPVSGYFSPSPTPPRRVRENDTSREIKPIFYPSLEPFQCTTFPDTPAQLAGSSTATRSQVSAFGSHAPVSRFSDDNPFINFGSGRKSSLPVKAEPGSRFPTPFTNFQSDSIPVSQRTTVKTEPRSPFSTPVADGDSSFDHHPNRNPIFQSRAAQSQAQFGLATPPATDRKSRSSIHPLPEYTPLQRNTTFNRQSGGPDEDLMALSKRINSRSSNCKPTFQGSTAKSEAQSSLVTPPATTRKSRSTVYPDLEDTPLKRNLFDHRSDCKPILQTPEIQCSFMTPPPVNQPPANVYQQPEGTPLRRSNFLPNEPIAWNVNSSNRSGLSGARSSKSSRKNEGPNNDREAADENPMALSRRINDRSSQELERPSDVLPRQLRALIYHGSAGIFDNGQKLKTYQAEDLQRLVLRELGQKVCGTDVINNVGFVLAYEMGLGKTVITIALIVINPAPEDFEGARATLVVVPNKGMMDQWRSEIKKFAPHLEVCYYHSGSATLKPNADVVLVTYAQLLLQHGAFEANPNSKSMAPLYHYFWWRKVNDEAHKYRNPETKTAAAVWAVRKRHGLCLTGTPAQNSLLDFYPLYKFLGVTHENVHDLATYQRKIYSKRQKGPIINPVALKLFELLKEYFCIFRSKIDSETGLALVDLPPRTDMVVEINLSIQERFVYKRIKESSLQIFAKLMRLRQSCDHPVLVPRPLAMDLELEDGEDADFDFCDVRTGLESPSFAIDKCPKTIQGMFSNSYSSSKLNAMMRVLKQCEGQKTIIFTHFTSLIPSLAQALSRANICWAEYTGGMSPKDQQAALKQIAEDKACSVIIISILAGSVGLNITSCNNVILLEPWWNPYTEEQAISRVHRIGQMLPVNVYRLVVNDSIEKSITETQLLKREMVGNMYGDLDEATQKAWLEGP